MEAARAMGAKYAIFAAKHCSGVLQWQTDLYPYGVRQSPWRSGKGDVVLPIRTLTLVGNVDYTRAEVAVIVPGISAEVRLPPY